MAKFKDEDGNIVIIETISKFIDGEMVRINKKTREPIKLEFVPNEEMPTLAVFTDTKSRFAKNAKHFKKRSKKHSDSSDQQELKRIRTQQELGGAIGRRDLKLRKRKTK